MGPYAGVSAVWMTGVEREPLVVPLAWRPDLLLNLRTEEAAARLRFVRREGNVEVYVDTTTGEIMYRGRTSPAEDLDPDVEKRFRGVVDTIEPLLTYDGHPRKLGWFQRRRLARGIRELESLAGDGRWRVWWFLGLARRSASDLEGAFAAFERAYAIHPTHADVAREFGGQCLALGRGERAVEVTERNCSLHPRDAGLRANLALACLIADDPIRAKLEVARALEMDPADEITRALAAMIDDVIAGRRPRPTTYP